MKGLAFNMIIFILIALVLVIVLISILNTFAPNFAGKQFCNFYRMILSLPLPNPLKPNIPGCSVYPNMERVKLTGEAANKQNIENLIEDCWKKSNYGRTGLNFICYEVYMDEVSQPFGKDDLETDLDGQIEWKTGLVSGQDLTLIVKYNSTSSKVEVV